MTIDPEEHLITPELLLDPNTTVMVTQNSQGGVLLVVMKENVIIASESLTTRGQTK